MKSANATMSCQPLFKAHLQQKKGIDDDEDGAYNDDDGR